MADEANPNSVIIFGRDITKIPCFRNSYLYGISSGVVACLTMFLFTSRPTLSSNVGFGTFVTVTLSYWVYCRHNWVQQKFYMRELQSALRQAHVLQDSDTEKEKEILEKKPKLHDA